MIIFIRRKEFDTMAEYIKREDMLAAFEKYYYDRLDEWVDTPVVAACVEIWSMLNNLPGIDIEQTAERG
jgi:hypothetical protein